MTGNVDFDRLADYVGGALDGTSDADAVARLVATDPEWIRAHTDLVAAEALARADLAALADRPEPMPEQMMARLAAAFDAEPPLTEPTVEEPLTEPPLTGSTPEPPLTGSTPEEPRRHLSALPGGRVDPVPAPTHRRWRALVGVAAAAALIGLGAISLTQVLRHDAGSVDSASGLSSQGRVAGPSAADTAAGNAVTDVRASGLDYDPRTLTALGGASARAQGTTIPRTEPRPNVLEAPPQPSGQPTGIPDPLQRLTAPDARAACLNAIQARYGGTATLLDYARFQGSPALIVVLDGAGGAAGHNWVVAVGPNCGVGGMIADQRYSGPAG